VRGLVSNSTLFVPRVCSRNSDSISEKAVDWHGPLRSLIED
jgi:hypothetical protein